jgi:hypothetical protein
MGYILIMFTHRASARVIKRWLIYGRFFFKFDLNILQITTSSMGCVRVIFTHRVHACGRGTAFAQLWTDYFQLSFEHTTNYHKQHGLRTVHVHGPRARARVREHTWFGVLLSVDGLSSNVLGTYYRSPQIAWATYFSFPRTARAWASRRVNHARMCILLCSLIFKRIISKFGGDIQQISRGYMGYLICV